MTSTTLVDDQVPDVGNNVSLNYHVNPEPAEEEVNSNDDADTTPHYAEFEPEDFVAEEVDEEGHASEETLSHILRDAYTSNPGPPSPQEVTGAAIAADSGLLHPLLANDSENEEEEVDIDRLFAAAPSSRPSTPPGPPQSLLPPVEPSTPPHAAQSSTTMLDRPGAAFSPARATNSYSYSNAPSTPTGGNGLASLFGSTGQVYYSPSSSSSSSAR